MEAQFLGHEALVVIDRARIADLKRMAETAPWFVARYCLHSDHEEVVQEMVIAMVPGACTMPHRQLGKRKSYVVLEGDLLVLFFDDTGAITRSIQLSPQSGGGAKVLSFASDVFHTTMTLGSDVVYLETIAGPFRPDAAEWAPWAPPLKDGSELRGYLNRLQAADVRLAANWPDGVPGCLVARQ